MKRLALLITAALVALCADASASKTVRGAKVLAYGSNGPEVDEVQALLCKLGHLNLKGNRPTGYFRTQTRQAVIAFQKANGIYPCGRWTAETEKKAHMRQASIKEREEPQAQRLVTLERRLVRKRSIIAENKPISLFEWCFGRNEVKHEPQQRKHASSVVMEQKTHHVYRRQSTGVTRTLASVFGRTVRGGIDTQDNGRGSGYLSDVFGQRINTRCTSLVGVALPIEEICRKFNVPPPPKRSSYPKTREGKRQWWEAVKRTWYAWEPVRKARVEILCPATGRCLSRVPAKIVDLGPGSGPRSRGVGIDLTYRLNKDIGGSGMTPVAYRITYAGQYNSSHMGEYASL